MESNRKSSQEHPRSFVPIPRTIHQIWIGSKPPPMRWTETWKVTHPDWDYRLWGEKELDELGIRNRELYDEYVADGRLPGAADLARVEILVQHGGVYVDADMSCRTPLHDAPFLVGEMFAVRSPHAYDRITNAVLGCTAGHPAMVAYHRALDSVTERYPIWEHVGAGLLTPLVTGRDDVTILPSGSFLPTTMHDTPGPSYHGVVYGEHHWGSTRNRY
jgi:mannosyltransferase OCH1-like enzyme